MGLRKNISDIIFLLPYLLLGIILSLFYYYFLNIRGESIMISLIVLPFILYLVNTGKISQLKGFGIDASFKDVAEKTPLESIGSQNISSYVEFVSSTEKKDIERRDSFSDEFDNVVEKIKNMDPSKPFSLKLKKNTNYYGKAALIQYLRIYSLFNTFRYVVISDIYDRVKAYVNPSTLIQILIHPNYGNMFLEYLNNQRLDEIINIPGIMHEMIQKDTKISDVLNIMNKYNINSIVIVDENNHYIGIVDKNRIISSVLLTMSSMK